MASDKHKLTLMSVPLEVRHHIFGYVAARDIKPKKLLRYWFEKEEVKEKTAELAAKDANAGALQVVFAGDQFEHEEYDSGSENTGEEDSDKEGDSDDDGDGDSDQDEEGDWNSSEDEDAEMDEAGGTANPSISTATTSSAVPVPATSAVPTPQSTAQQATVVATQSTGLLSAGAGQAVTAANQGLLAALAAANAAIQTAMATVATLLPPAPATSLPASASVQMQGQSDEGHGDGNADMGEDEQEHHQGTAEEMDEDMDEEEDNEEAGELAGADTDEEMAEEDDDGAVQPVVVITAHRKWRHIPKFMRITHSPPPIELFLTSKQVNAEANSWFYGVAVLRIDATGSFAHTSFFEEAFSQITEAAFSPMENIRKVEITFVWDTTWLRSEQADCAGAIFPALLRQRALFVTDILAQAPNLDEVTIHWHDSAEDEEAMDLMNDVLMGFLSLDANVKVEPHYIAADAKPYRKSIAGRQRVEFQRIVDNGLDRLF